MTFLYQWRVGVRRSGKDDRWCGFNALISPREEGRWDEVLLKDEEESASSYWLHGKET
jgi:hypothetical protein